MCCRRRAFFVHQSLGPLQRSFSAQNVLNVELARLVAAPYERAARYVKETHPLGNILPALEFRRLDVTVDLHVPLRWPHVLPESHNVHVDFPQLWKEGVK